MGWKPFQTVCHQVAVFLQFRNRKRAFFIIVRQICFPQNMEKLQFHSLNRGMRCIIDGLQYVFPGFSGETENQVRDHRDAPFLQQRNAGFIAFQRKFSAYETGSSFMDSLKSELNPDRLLLIQLREKIQNFF